MQLVHGQQLTTALLGLASSYLNRTLGGYNGLHPVQARHCLLTRQAVKPGMQPTQPKNLGFESLPAFMAQPIFRRAMSSFFIYGYHHMDYHVPVAEALALAH